MVIKWENARADRLTNILFKLPKRELYIWRSSADKEVKIVKNQFNYILNTERHNYAIISAQKYLSAENGSDHNPVVTKIRQRIKQIKRRSGNPNPYYPIPNPYYQT